MINRIEQSRNPIVPLYAEAHVEFRIIDDMNRAWEIIKTPDGETFYARGHASFTFTSAMTLNENLHDFADFMLEPSHPPVGPHPDEDPYYQAVVQIYREFCNQLFENENYKTCIKGITLEPNDEKLLSGPQKELTSPEEWMIIVIFKQETQETLELPKSFKGVKIKAQNEKNSRLRHEA